MKRFGILMAMVMVSLVFVNEGWAGVKHYVASYGSDANLCTLALPCRSFSHAVDVTDPGGEVIVLDTGGYGSVTITKSISIIAPVGMYASVTYAPNTNGITIDAGEYGSVLIKGLTFVGQGLSWSGIGVNTVKTLIVDNCFFNGFSYSGISSQAPDSELVILNSKINSKVISGVSVWNSSGSVSVSMNNVEMVDNSAGLQLSPSGTGNVSATVSNSLANNNNVGFSNSGTSSGISVLNLENCIASGNTFGISSNNNSATDVIRISNCTVTENTNHGIYREPGTSGTVYTRGNNTVMGNGTDSNVTPTVFSAW